LTVSFKVVCWQVFVENPKKDKRIIGILLKNKVQTLDPTPETLNPNPETLKTHP